jgi:pyocin large subunit-like protein
MNNDKPETPPLTRAGRKVADAALAAAKFKPTSDGKSAMRRFEVHGMAVTECVDFADALPSSKPAEKNVASDPVAPSTQTNAGRLETPALSKAERKVADAALAAAQFIASSDGKNAMRRFEVHGMAVTEVMSAEKAAGADVKKAK